VAGAALARGFGATRRGTEARMHWIWFLIVGAIVGMLGRLFHPGRDPIGLLFTVVIGVLSLAVAAAISSGWLAFVIGVVIAILLVALVGRMWGERTAARRV
jgi:uncharacterized membrane protein YeaQ/YmgE (transglycosylase-associated protein family)